MNMSQDDKDKYGSIYGYTTESLPNLVDRNPSLLAALFSNGGFETLTKTLNHVQAWGSDPTVQVQSVPKGWGRYDGGKTIQIAKDLADRFQNFEFGVFGIEILDPKHKDYQKKSRQDCR